MVMERSSYLVKVEFGDEKREGVTLACKGVRCKCLESPHQNG